MARKVVTLKIEGTEDLKRKLRRLGKKAFTQLDPIVKDAAEILVAEVKARAPVRKGTLRRSIHASKAFAKKGVVEYHVGPDRSGFYARFFEFGTRFKGKKPFIRPAADAKEEQITNALARGLNKVLSSEDE